MFEIQNPEKETLSRFDFTYRYLDDVFPINGSDFENDLGRMYPAEHDIKDTIGSKTSSSYFDLLLSIGRDGMLRIFLYDEHEDFNFHVKTFSFLSSNIPSSTACGVFTSKYI